MAKLRHGPPVFHSGWLEKEGVDGERWMRFLRLSGTALSNSHSDVEHPSWRISLLECPVSVGPRPLEIQIQLRRRTLSYFASDERDFYAWQHALTRAMEMRIDNFYQLGHVLGEGSFATVRMARDVRSGQQFAIKIIHKNMYKPDELQWVMREAKIMMNVQHANIVDTYDVFDSMDHLHLVIEYMEGGELFDIVADQGHLSERSASLVVRDIIKGVEYLHDVGVVHCDIKPENILCKSKQWPYNVKLCDFGLANFFDKHDNNTMTETIGTPGYVAPEVVRRQPYGPPVDMWACGVVLYVMLSGRMPFYGSNDIQCLRRTANGEYSFPEREWKHVSEDAKSLVRSLLQIRPELRLTAKAALQHRWIAQPENLNTVPLQNDLSQIHSRVRQKFRKAVTIARTIEKMKDLISGLPRTSSTSSGNNSSSQSLDS